MALDEGCRFNGFMMNNFSGLEEFCFKTDKT